jgi:hypothetical protein
MIKISFSIKRSPGKLNEPGKLEGILINLNQREKKQGIIRLKTLSSIRDNRLKSGQLVITKDGLGTIKECMCKKDDHNRLILPNGVNISVKNLKFKDRVYRLSEVNVVDIVDNKSGTHYPAAESDYSRLLVDDTPVQFVVTRKNKALLTERSRQELEKYVIFAKKQNGIKTLYELIEKNIWNPTKR